jgi:hypothetical protein
MYQLHALEALIAQQQPLSVDCLDAEQQKIETALLQILYSERTPESIRLYLSQHVERIHQLLRAQQLEQSADHVVAMLQRLICFLEQHGRPYWNYELQVPLFRKQVLILQIEQLLPQLTDGLERLPFPPHFAPTFIADIRELLYRDLLTYGQICMLQDMTAAILDLLDEFSLRELAPKRLLRDLWEILYLYNFNSLNMYEFAAVHIQQEIGDGLSYNLGKLGRLYAYYSKFNVVQGYAYQHYRPTLVSLTADYLSVQMDTLRMEVYPADTYLPASSKLPTTLTQDKLGYLSRVMIDEQYITTSNWKDVARFMSAHVGTIGKTGKEPSADSVYNNMFSPNMKTVVSTLEIVDKLRNRIISWKTALKTTGKPPET